MTGFVLLAAVGLSLHVEPEEPRQLLPTVLEVSGAGDKAPRLQVTSARFGRRHGTTEEVTLERTETGTYRSLHTFRGEGPYIIQVTSGEDTLEREVTVAPQTWLSFGTEFGWFAAGVVVLAALTFGVAHLIRKRARTTRN